jgi:hypothetical protein
LLLSPVLFLPLSRLESNMAIALSSSATHEVIMSLSLLIELGKWRPKSLKVRGGKDHIG